MFESRQWGWMVKLVHIPGFWLKFLRVRGRTSYQTHKRRTEYHLSISKMAPEERYRVRVARVKPNEKHRLSYGWYIEVATGDPKEEDCIRLEDDYGRA